jgi:hypothetical protein
MEERNREVLLCQTVLFSNDILIEHFVVGYWLIIKWWSNGTRQELSLMLVLELSLMEPGTCLVPKFD